MDPRSVADGSHKGRWYGATAGRRGFSALVPPEIAAHVERRIVGNSPRNWPPRPRTSLSRVPSPVCIPEEAPASETARPSDLIPTK